MNVKRTEFCYNIDVAFLSMHSVSYAKINSVYQEPKNRRHGSKKLVEKDVIKFEFGIK